MKQTIFRTIFLSLVLIVCWLIFFGFAFGLKEINNPILQSLSLEEKEIILAGERLKVKIADTTEKREKGLAGISNLSGQEGMLFLFDEPQRTTFWNKGMLIPVDIVWLRDNIVIGIDWLPAQSNGLTIIGSPEKINQVLELPLNWTKNHQLEVGSKMVVLE